MKMTLKISVILIVIFLIAVFLIAQPSMFFIKKSNSTSFSENQMEEKPWEKILLKFTDERLKEIGYPTLKEKPLTSDSKEIRFWIGFDLSPLRGLILEKNDSNWKAIYIPPKKTDENKTNLPIVLSEPKSGWNKLIEKLESLNIEKIPDMSDLDIELHGYDLKVVVIEVKTPKGYRNYMYRGLDIERIVEMEYPQKVKEICMILTEEFGIDMFYYNPE